MEHYLRKANALDKKLYFNWANDAETRKNSFSIEPIAWEDHDKWYDEKMADKNTEMFVLMDFFKPLGQVRLAIEENVGIISYSVDADERGKGIGREMLLLLEKEMAKKKSSDFTLIAYVKEENVASNKVFESLGYTYYDDQSYRKTLSQKAEERKAKPRDKEFEVLRVLSMLMVIVLHYLSKGGLLHPLSQDMSGSNLGFWLLESFCLCCVNVYVLISGYYMVNSRFTISKVVRIWGQVFFYSVGITLVALITGITKLDEIKNMYDLAFLGLPVSMGHYWFATAYVFLLILSPVLAMAAKKMSQKQLGLTVVILLLVFSGIKSFLPVRAPYDNQGNDIVWFVCLFMVAAYIRLYGLSFIKTKLGAFIGFVVSALSIWVLAFSTGILVIQTGRFDYYLEQVTDYNYIPVFIGSVCLFMVFKLSEFKDNPVVTYIAKIAPYTFGVYLLHEHILVAHKWIKWLRVDETLGSLRIVHIVLTVLIIFCAGIIVDYIRSLLFKLISKIVNWGLGIYYTLQEAFSYLVFGGLATVVNWIVYFIVTRLYLEFFFAGQDTFNTMVGTVVSWIVTVVFAYWTNKTFVFRSEVKGFKGILKEFITFVSARLATFGIELLGMFIMVDTLKLNDIVSKLLLGIIVIVLNYIFSKLFIFAKKGKKNEQK